MNIEDFKSTLNKWGQGKVPFLFVVDFEMEKPLAWKVEEINAEKILFDLNGVTNSKSNKSKEKILLDRYPMPLSEYQKAFDVVMKHLDYGDSFLTNLTIKTKIATHHSLFDLFYLSRAKYKLMLENQFLVFSPETFIQIKGGKIYSYPMKGTIDASLPNAEEKILSDQKELSEHVTIVDLIRNDLSIITENVEVTKFRYIDKITTSNSTLLQVSSEIKGDLPKDYGNHLGDIIVSLLPAGSISGAPKAKTLEIISKAEKSKRGYYTGVFGYFDGVNLDSGVMIRFIEQQGNEYFYRSGGGITTQSILQSEYMEAINKIYVPID
jgi:para-aminobenzoate synthetase component 1